MSGDTNLQKISEESIPICIFSINSLQVLKLSGIGLSGTLHSDTYLTPSMTTLRLGYNLLRGVVPNSFLERNLDELDLSNNFLSGTWNFMNNSNTSIVLNNNRLSGLTPLIANDMTQVDVMKGNLFDCDNKHHATNDPNYQCKFNSIY